MTNKVLVNSINSNERIILGCRAICGESVKEIAYEANTNRQFIYDQKSKVDGVLQQNFNKKESNIPVILMSEKLINRIILSSVLDCKGSVRDVKEHLHNVFNFDISVGKISSIITEAVVKAKEFNQKIVFDTIKIGVHDEIFQAGDPVLVGMDPYSTYIYLMEASKKRDAISWCMAIYDKFLNQGLNLDTSVTDGGLGMKKGIKEVYPEIKEQADIFHAEIKLTLGLVILERKAYSSINEEYENQAKLKRASAKKKDNALLNYDNAVKKSIATVTLYDRVNILIGWIKEVFSVGGYSYEDKLNLLNYLIDEINTIPHGNKQLEESIKSLSLNNENLLLFVKVAQEQLELLAKDEDVNGIILDLMWKQKLYCETSRSYWKFENEILENGEYQQIKDIRNKFELIMKKLVRASSIVECINSLIRPYLFLRRTLKGKFLDLLQFYFNTRKYMESRVPERKGKSPLELLTGKEQGLWLDILGY